MNYKLLQVGDEIQEGDQWHRERLAKYGWLPCTEQTGSHVTMDDLENGVFYRRPKGRTDIEIVAPDDGESGFWVSLKNAKEFDLEDDNYTLSVPIAYAQKVIDAIKEVAGL